MEYLILVSILLAIGLSILGFIILLKYRHFGSDKTELLDQKLALVNNALDSCEKMIDELNKLSDYIITNVEQKSVELKDNIDKADEKINLINNMQVKPNFEAVLKPESPETAKNTDASPLLKLSGHFRKNAGDHPQKEKTIPEENITVAPKTAVNAYKTTSELIKPKVEEPSKYIVDTVVIDQDDKGRDKGKMYAFVVSSKAKDVIELSKQGFDTTEIAKRLGIGKGEIELILGIKK